MLSTSRKCFQSTIRVTAKLFFGAVLFAGVTILVVSCGSPSQTQQILDVEANFADRRTFALTGGDTDEAGLSGFQRDSFRTFFDQALIEILTQRGLTDVGASQTDSADYIIRYILRDKLIITALDPDSRRLIWRGQSEDGLTAADLSASAVKELVDQAIGDFPPEH